MAVYRSWAITSAGTIVHARRLRAERLSQQLDMLRSLRQEAGRDLLVESRKHSAVNLLRQIPSIGPLRAARLVALLQTPRRFRTKRQLSACNGFGLETHDRGEYGYRQGQLRRNMERVTVRGLNDNHIHDLRNLFKSAASSAGSSWTVSRFLPCSAREKREALNGQSDLTRKIAAITLRIWKEGVRSDAKELHPQAA